jgi:hypothetical protein
VSPKKSGRSPGNPGKKGNPVTDPDFPGGGLSDKGKHIFQAAVDLVGRTGAKEFQARWQDDEKPTVFMAVGKWGDNTYEVGAGMDPVTAVLRLLDQIIDGGICTHCFKPTGVSDDFERTMPLGDMFCWYQYDPELKKFRRGCE